MDNERLEGVYISRVAWECAKFYQDPENIKTFYALLKKMDEKQKTDK